MSSSQTNDEMKENFEGLVRKLVDCKSWKVKEFKGLEIADILNALST